MAQRPRNSAAQGRAQRPLGAGRAVAPLGQKLTLMQFKAGPKCWKKKDHINSPLLQQVEQIAVALMLPEHMHTLKIVNQGIQKC